MQGGTLPLLSPETLWELPGSLEVAVAFDRAGVLHYLFRSAEAVHQILVSHADYFLKGDQEVALAAAIGYGLLSDEGSTHRQRQRAISPGFRAERLQQYLETIQASAKLSIGSIPSGESVGLVNWTREFSQASAERALFPSGNRSPNYAYHKAVSQVNEMAMRGIDEHLSAQQSREYISQYQSSRSVIQEYVEHLVSQWQQSPNQPSLIDLMVLSGEAGDDEPSGLYPQVALFLQAAVETTASLLAWTLIQLGLNPHYWEELSKEARQNPIGTLSAKELVSLPWHHAVLNESLRLHPPAWLIPRVVREDCEIAGVVLKRGSRVIVSPWVSHRSERYFSQPGEFLPERWLTPNGPDTPRGAYFPFGLGNRICIGERYGKLTAATMIHQMAGLDRPPILQGESLEIGSSSLIAIPRSNVLLSL